MKRKAILSALSIVAATAALALGTPARADGHGNGHQQGNRGHGNQGHGHDHRADGNEGHHNWHNGCPPGLIATGGRCVPPGQYRRGDHLRDGDFRVLSDWRDYRLPPLPYGERYVIVNGDQVLRINRDTMTVLAEIGLLNALLNH